MRILLDEDVPRQALDVLRHVLRDHDVEHVHTIGWSGKADTFLYRDAAKGGYEIVVMNDARQMSDPDECTAVKQSGVHRVSYNHRLPGKRGLAVAIASLIAAMPDVVKDLSNADGQRLVAIEGINPARKRYSVVDPRHEPPGYWPR